MTPPTGYPGKVRRIAEFAWQKRDRILPMVRHRMVPTALAMAHGAGLLWGENERRLAAYKDCHRGERAFIVGTGPSLTMEDLDALQGDICFASNRITLAYDSTEWRPTYYAIHDLVVARQMKDEVPGITADKFFCDGVRSELGPEAGIYLTTLPRLGPDARFSRNLLSGAYDGASVTLLLLHLAYFMGVSEAYLVGVDNSYVVPQTAKQEPEEDLQAGGNVRIPGASVLTTDLESNHFHPGYRKTGEAWLVPEYERIESAFRAARRAFEADGRVLANASRTTALKALDRVSLDDLLPAGG